jgi:hypothetical protein
MNTARYTYINANAARYAYINANAARYAYMNAKAARYTYINANAARWGSFTCSMCLDMPSFCCGTGGVRARRHQRHGNL